MSPKAPRCSIRSSTAPCTAQTMQTDAQGTVDLMFRAFSDRTRLRILHVLRVSRGALIPAIDGRVDTSQ